MRVFILLAVFWLTGCASSQLNSNTADIATSSGDLMKSQIVYNIEKYMTDSTAIPAQVTVNSGAATTTYTVTPTVSFPLTAMTAVQGVVGATPNVTNTHAGAGAGLSASDSWGQDYIFEPVTDSERFRRLDALYRFEITGDRRALLSDFLPIHKTVTENVPHCVSDSDHTLKLKGKVVTNCLTEKKADDGTISKGSSSIAIQVEDEYFQKGKGCALCLVEDRWLRSDPPTATVPAPLPGDQPLASRGPYRLYVAAGHGRDYARFVAAILLALNGVTSSNAGGGGSSSSSPGGGSARRKRWSIEDKLLPTTAMTAS